MVEKYQPESNKVQFITQNCMLHILSGTGGIEIDFKTFHNWDNKLIFLEKGQYIKFLSDDFLVRKIDFDEEVIFRDKDFRVLFKHLVSLGYINFDECTDCQRYMESAILTNPDQILDISSKQWFWQNPFNANTEEYHLIFDIKELIDDQFMNHPVTEDIVSMLEVNALNPQRLYSKKVGITISSMLAQKRLSASKKELAFSNKSIKEIAYEHGYKDPSWFNRFFKNKTGRSPMQFREESNFQVEDFFAQDIYELIRSFHASHREVGFYADKLNMSVRSLSRKMREELQASIGQLIRQEMIKTARKHLKEGQTIKEISRILCFEEPNHFTSFFKHYTGITPTEYLNQKVQ